MGCFNATEVSNEKPKNIVKVKPYKGKEQQGVKELKLNYIINSKTKVLGTGQFGRVFKTCRTNDKTAEVAIKVLDKHKLEEHLEQVIEEVRILNRLDHPNIVNYFETYDDKKYLYLVMEYVKGMELFEKITHKAN